MILFKKAYLKKHATILLPFALTVSLLAGCGKSDLKDTATAKNQTDKVAEASSDASNSEPNYQTMYLDFLTGKTKMIVNSDRFSIFPKGNQYSYEEMTTTLSNDIAAEFEGEKPLTNAQYAFVDCGMDGVPEMALMQNYDALDGISVICLFSVQNNQVQLGSISQGYYRTSTEINQYGVITYGGSGSAWSYMSSYYTLNKDGEEVFLYSVETEMGLSEPYIQTFSLPDGAVPEDYPMDMYADECDDNCISSDCYSFIEYNSDEDFDENTYHMAQFYAFYKDDGSYVSPNEEFAGYYDKAGIVYGSLDEAKEKVDKHIKELGFDAKCIGSYEDIDSVDWVSLSSLGIGTYTQVPICKADVVNMMQGDWMYQANDKTSDTLYLSIRPDADFQLDITSADSNIAPQFARGHLIITEQNEYYPPEYCVTFYVEESNMENIDPVSGLGAYELSSITNSGTEVIMSLRMLEDYNSFYNNAYSDHGPVFSKKYKEEVDVSQIYVSMYSTGNEAFCYNEEATAVVPSLREVSCTENEITDEDRWFSEVGYDSSNPYTIGDYTYELLGEEQYYCITKLNVFDSATRELKYTFDLHDLKYADGFEDNEFVDRSIHFAQIVDHTLYLNLYHRTYAETCPFNAYVIAIDLDYNSFDWQSEPLMCNCENFIVKDDVIIAGYGFTDEDHYLTVLNRYNGKLLQKIPVKKSPEYLKLNGNQLYVRTYSYDYVFEIE